VNDVLARWNNMSREDAAQNILPCCGARVWAAAMAARRPFESVASLCEASKEIWWSLDSADWLEAFRSHPRIGESQAAVAPLKSQGWSSQEQHQIADANDALRLALVHGNRQYEERFGRIFIVCATGKSPAEILENLHRRLRNDDAVELREAAKEQDQIIQIRLRKWLAE
jgi:2-oxo-4-hydroxy-4-carboxy-5-ureidoimidazoline decarboxylase